MTDPTATLQSARPEPWEPPDRSARERIARDLETSLLVEAGAGSGKTTAMVGRMVRLVCTGTATVDRIAAVTFTRKAAAELRERFQEALEAEHRRSHSDPDRAAEADRLAAALDHLDRCFVGTIHAFCARLLRERPLEARIPPDFEEVTGAEEERLRLESWTAFLERIDSREYRIVRRLREVGIRPAQLKGLFRELSDNPDVRYTARQVAAPGELEIARVRAQLEELLDASKRLLPRDEPRPEWDRLQKKVRTLSFSRSVLGWDDRTTFLDALGAALAGKIHVVQKRWSEKAGKEEVKRLERRWTDFCAEDGAARALHDRWLAHRYPYALRFARAAAAAYARDRRRSGKLTFQDLLMLTAELLRSDREARRELGTRYRYLLVDEFQDTDPVQAEILFLLASEPGSERHWSEVVPRPGSLFVVGDPKQSIYRFRRADISVYAQVKRRFGVWGDVLGLSANFRSTPPIEAFVNAAFEGPFPPRETEHQAAFAPLAVRPLARPFQGVYWYSFDPAPGRGSFEGVRIAEPDSRLIASWVAERVERGERTAGDFLILTWTKSQLATYARALEKMGLPVQVSGAAVGAEEELRELIILLRALRDPSDPVLTLAVLEGLFFGLSHEELYTHVRLGGSFSFMWSGQPADSPAAAALRRLHTYWTWARDLPADVAIGRIVDALGVLPHAAAGELGSTRAGALLHALAAVRAAALDGATSLAAAVEALEIALDAEVDAPLFPGRGDAVRLMNLHKAKGLEARVVVLAYPCGEREHGIFRHIARDPGGAAYGYVSVQDSTQWSRRVIARPADWAAHEAAEQPYDQAENVRLLYVAATRAAEELVVARCTATATRSVWKQFEPWLARGDLASELSIAERQAVERPAMTLDGAAIQERIAALQEQRAALAAPSLRTASITELAKADAALAALRGGGAGRGTAWGRAVHRALELAAAQVTATDLARGCRTILVEEERPTDERGDPIELPELLALLEALRGSSLWRRARDATHRLAEVPFMLSLSPEDGTRMGLEPEDPSRPLPLLVEGVIDLAFRAPAGSWVIADYKTDRFPDDNVRRARTEVYRRQVDLYAACWERITGEVVQEKVILFTGLDTGLQEESWR